MQTFQLKTKQRAFSLICVVTYLLLLLQRQPVTTYNIHITTYILWCPLCESHATCLCFTVPVFEDKYYDIVLSNYWKARKAKVWGALFSLFLPSFSMKSSKRAPSVFHKLYFPKYSFLYLATISLSTHS